MFSEEINIFGFQMKLSACSRETGDEKEILQNQTWIICEELKFNMKCKSIRLI